MYRNKELLDLGQGSHQKREIVFVGSRGDLLVGVEEQLLHEDVRADADHKSGAARDAWMDETSSDPETLRTALLQLGHGVE